MRPETTYNNSGKSSYAYFEIGPDLNKPYVQVAKQQIKIHHKINPSIKMISLIFFIILIFIPFGFLFQVILIGIIFASLDFKITIWKIMKNFRIYFNYGFTFNIDKLSQL